MPPLGVTEPIGRGNEILWENLNLFRIYGSPDGTDLVTILPREITRSLAAGLPQKALFLW